MKTRRHYLDNIRWATVVIVAVYHIIYIFNGVQPFGVIGPFHENQWQDGFQYLVYPWFMALLFVVSGMSARYCLEKMSAGAFLRDRSRKLLVPSTLGLFAFQWILGLYNMKIGGGLGDLSALPAPALYLIAAVSGTGVLWYIQLLWLFSVLLLAVRRLEKDRLWRLCEAAPAWLLVLLALPFCGSAQILNPPVVTVYRFGIFGFCFFCGYFLFSHDAVIDRLGRWSPAFCLVAAALGVSYTFRYFGENYAVEPVVNNLHACLYAWLAILAILTAMKKYADKTTPFTDWMQKKAWGLYVLHYLPLAVSAYHLHKATPALPPVLVYGLVTVCTFGGALLLNEIISRIPILRWCVLGIKKEKKHV